MLVGKCECVDVCHAKTTEYILKTLKIIACTWEWHVGYNLEKYCVSKI